MPLKTKMILVWESMYSTAVFQKFYPQPNCLFYVISTGQIQLAYVLFFFFFVLCSPSLYFTIPVWSEQLMSVSCLITITWCPDVKMVSNGYLNGQGDQEWIWKTISGFDKLILWDNTASRTFERDAEKLLGRLCFSFKCAVYIVAFVGHRHRFHSLYFIIFPPWESFHISFKCFFFHWQKVFSCLQDPSKYSCWF